MYFHVHVKCILIKIKFDIDINNNEPFKTIWKHKEKNNIVDSVRQAQMIY